jgi:hypothetical protein
MKNQKKEWEGVGQRGRGEIEVIFYLRKHCKFEITIKSLYSVIRHPLALTNGYIVGNWEQTMFSPAAGWAFIRRKCSHTSIILGCATGEGPCTKYVVPSAHKAQTG